MSRQRKFRIESLEPRTVLAATPIISEFMASNDNTLDDGDGQSSDWIEVYNPTQHVIDLAGWHLTDDADNLRKWAFPDVDQAIIHPGDYRLVFASGQSVGDYVDPQGFLHTNFRLSAGGEYLGLTTPSGAVVFDFGPEYPPQRTDVSYGFSSDSEVFISDSNATSALVPTDNSLDSTSVAPPIWAYPDFDDSLWPNTLASGGVGVGYDQFAGGPDGPEDGTRLAALVGNDLTDPDEDGVYAVSFAAGLSGSSPVNEEPVRALDNRADTKWLAFDPAGTFYEMSFLDGIARHVDRYTITSANDVDERDPFRWTLSGSNDGANYTVIDLRTEQEFANRLETRLYEFSNELAFQHYRFEFETEFGATGQNEPVAIQLAEIELLSSSQLLYDSLIRLDVQSAWEPIRSSVYQRVKFEVDQPDLVDQLTLTMQYDDGFVAYLNGTKVAESNAPVLTSWQSQATTGRDDSLAIVPAAFDIREYADLLVSGENALAIHVLNVNDESSDLLSVPGLTATLLDCEFTEAVFYDAPSPLQENGVGQKGFTAPISFDVERGFFESGFQLNISSPTADADVYYTTNGDEPSVGQGTLYSGPIPVDSTTVIKAAAFREDYYPSATETHSYFFVSDIVRQDFQWTIGEAGFPNTWGGVTPDYGMDRQVIGDFDENGNSLGGDLFGGIYAATIQDDLQAIPTLSISMDADSLFGPNGIYANSTSEGVEWERATSFELIYPDGSPGFQVNAGLRMQGGAFRRHDLSRKHSFRILFKSEYGPTKLEFPFFGSDATDRFDTLTLRMESNDGYAWNAAGASAQYARDAFANRSQAALGQPAIHNNRMHLYLNGVYWGLYNPVERPDASFSASYYGGEKEEWDAISDGKVIDGTGTAWTQLNQLARDVQQASDENARRAAYQRILGNHPDGTNDASLETFLDLDNYVDYLLVNFYVGNQDWPQRNWYASRRRGAESTGFKFHSWDAETAMNLGNDVHTNRLSVDFEVAEPYARLRSSEEFRLRFADRAHRALFHGGAFTTDEAMARYEQILDEVERPLVAESTRWGDMHSSVPYTPSQWADEAASVINTFIRPRAAILLNQLRDAELYPAIDAPSFNQHGGDVPIDFDLTMNATAGEIYYTVDGSDPRSVTGQPVGSLYESSIAMNGSTTVKARVFYDGKWSALNEADFVVTALAGDFNSDGLLDCVDANNLSLAIAQSSSDPTLDLTGDGQINGSDMSRWLSAAGAVNLGEGQSYEPGDANLDGAVDVSDFNIWNGNKFTATAEWCSGDFTLDGIVDVSDFNVWNGNKFSSSVVAPSVDEMSVDEMSVDEMFVDELFGDDDREESIRLIDRVFAYAKPTSSLA